MKKALIDNYNMRQYKFSLSTNLLNNIINDWKKHNNKFNEFCIFQNQKNLEGEKILKKYSYEYIETEEKKDRQLILLVHLT